MLMLFFINGTDTEVLEESEIKSADIFVAAKNYQI